jgi:ureidoacrylate peracid hydrolase
VDTVDEAAPDGGPQGPDAATAFLADRTALLVIDPVNDFLSEGGADWDMTRSTVEKHDVVGHLRRAIIGARRHRVPVLFGPMAFTAEDYADAQLQRRSGINRMMFERRMFLAGSWGADFHPDLQPQQGDVVLLPHKGVDVFQSDLPEHLERLGTTHLVIAGMTANLCCESTGRHAMERGYDVTFLRDAIGADTVAAYEVAVRLNYPLIGNGVLTVVEFLDALTDGPRLPRKGDAVVGSDRLRIGTLKEVVPATGNEPGYLIVRRSLRRSVHIPLDAVARVLHRRVVVNVPRLFVAKMPWQQPPSGAFSRSKLGPPAAGVDALYRSHQPSLLQDRPAPDLRA